MYRIYRTLSFQITLKGSECGGRMGKVQRSWFDECA